MADEKRHGMGQPESGRRASMLWVLPSLALVATIQPDAPGKTELSSLCLARMPLTWWNGTNGWTLVRQLKATLITGLLGGTNPLRRFLTGIYPWKVNKNEGQVKAKSLSVMVAERYTPIISWVASSRTTGRGLLSLRREHIGGIRPWLSRGYRTLT
jgi:hypothetical protein